MWGHRKRTTLLLCDYTLRSNIPTALDSILLDTIQNFIQKSRNYMCAYLVGEQPGTEMDKVVKKFNKEYKSHRRVNANDYFQYLVFYLKTLVSTIICHKSLNRSNL